MTLWPTVDFASAVEDVTGGNVKTLESDYLDEGPYPIVDQGQKRVAGHTSDPKRLVRSRGPLIVFGDHTTCFKYLDEPFALGADGVKVLRPKTGFDAKFLYHYLSTRRLPHVGYSRHFKFLKQVSIPAPPYEEQQRISEVLDRAEALRKRRRKALALLDDLTRSIFIDMFGDFRGNYVTTNDGLVHPGGWNWVALSDLATLATGHTPHRSRGDYWGGGIPWISLPEIRGLDGQIANGTVLTIAPAGVTNSSAVVLPEGTVCLSRTASLGFVTIMGRPMATSQDFVNWVVGDRLRPTYLMYALLLSRSRLRAISDGSTHKTIYMRIAERFRVLLPPLKPQIEFERRLQAVWRLQELQRSALSGAEVAISSLQERAFAGEL